MQLPSGNPSPFVPILVAIACSLAEAGDPRVPGDLPKAFRVGTAAIEGMTLAWAARPGNAPAARSHSRHLERLPRPARAEFVPPDEIDRWE